MNEWFPIGAYPGYRCDIDPVRADHGVAYWGEVNPDESGWSWGILAVTDEGQREVDGGRAETEAAARSAVESWMPRHAS